jgi:hypothetical protein
MRSMRGPREDYSRHVFTVLVYDVFYMSFNIFSRFLTRNVICTRPESLIIQANYDHNRIKENYIVKLNH